MARKPSDVIQYKIRIREDLRRRLEQEAKRHDRSINSEIASRLAESFDLPNLGKITARLENVYEQYARETHDRLQAQELIDAAEYLAEQSSAEAQDPEAVKRAIAWVQKAVKAITDSHGRMYDHEPWEK